MTGTLRRLSPLLALLLAVILALVGSVSAMDMDDMPDDPVSGEMVMSRAYNFQLKNGQRLRFASQNSLDAFVKDPTLGLKGVASPPAPHGHRHDESEENVLCPVCGMESSVSSGPQVVMVHGDQAVHTCSMTHAREVLNDVLSFQAAKDGATTATEQEVHGFCSGPGTTMLNGFSFSGSSTPCILLWFPGWVLDSRVRYILGGILVALVAVFNEYLLQLRRVLRRESSVKRLLSSNAPHATESAQLLRSTAPLADSCGPTWFRTLSSETQHAVHSFLHGVTLFVAYMLMLVSMTYDLTLLLWVVTGYVVGHYVFGEHREAAVGSGDMESNFP
ncbi:hypothetical protein PR003_g4128 [Phytophthora rubi]|uniref:Copper transport protein n=1 Tax=Phytophthora rubi TaxID=129364 RepID=A0A6A4G6R0_9STRA|nr:hypothetical protein PR002_g4022 [Phytophthora rubi]KAE9047407.1 hypothetical protein PR001_g4208 [Phytophthora rubi]KAE9352913.1 hypothetical protein PR003_g4128 [Phytophthora rubi]